MFQVKRDFEAEYYGRRDVAFTKALNPALLSFEQWAQTNRAAIPLG